MPTDPPTGLYDPQPRQLVVRDLLMRTRKRLDATSDAALADLLEDALYQERKRLERQEPGEGESERLDVLAKALVRGDRHDRVDAALGLVAAWGDEVHGHFSNRAYRFATRVLPRAFTSLLSPRPRHLRDVDLTPESRIKVEGDLDLLRQLCREATLVLTPTHVSNLDSPLIGLGLNLAGLPPFVYGAGLNLFSNPVMGWWLGRLGAYTVDRTKRAKLYKEVLKDYSVRCLVTHHHSLFFPGGTRARNGAIEDHLKKGLLGTCVEAWQEMLEAKREQPEVYIVPCTLSFQLVLEASTLIDDHLAESGKQRYIITDDEFTQPRRVLGFARRVLDLDDSVVLRFGAPLDCLGNPVSADPEERAAQAQRRRRYVCNADGEVQRDPQRDRVYTDRLADALIDAYPRNSTIMATHLTAWVAWRLLEERAGNRDPFRIVRMAAETRTFSRESYLARLAGVLKAVDKGVAEGRWCSDLAQDPRDVLTEALDRFGRYHRSKVLRERGAELFVEDPKLCLYYRNRLVFTDLEA